MLWGDWNVCTFETLRLPLAKGRFFRKPTFYCLYTPFGSPVSGGQKPSLPLKKGVLKSSRPSLPLKKAPPFSPSLSSIVFTTPSVPLIGDRNPQGREDVTALRCSEPLRYKDGGPSKVSPGFAGWDRLGKRVLSLKFIVYNLWFIAYIRGILLICCVFLGILEYAHRYSPINGLC